MLTAADDKLDPYPETSFRLSRDADELTVSAPWMSVTLRIPTQLRSHFLLSKRFRGGRGARTHAGLHRQLYMFPLFRAVPRRALLDPSVPPYRPGNAALLSSVRSPRTLLEAVASSASEPTSKLLRGLRGHRTWRWPVRAICERARLSRDRYDPLALITELVRYGLKTEMRNQFRTDLLRELTALSQQDPVAFREAAIIYARQTHFVTLNCNRAVSPACNAFPEGRRVVKKFLQEEANHDRLIALTLRRLGRAVPSEVAVLAETSTSVELLRYAAQNDFFAFTCMIPQFEGYAFAEDDPFAMLLRNSDLAGAEIGFSKHYEINKNPRHSAIGRELINVLPAVTGEAAEIGIRFGELIVRLQEALALHLIDLIRTSRRSVA